MLGTATKVRTQPSVKKSFISVDLMSFRMYLTDVLRSVNDCYNGQVLGDVHIALSEVSMKRYAIYT